MPRILNKFSSLPYDFEEILQVDSSISYQPKKELNLVNMLENALFVHVFGYV